MLRATASKHPAPTPRAPSGPLGPRGWQGRARSPPAPSRNPGDEPGAGPAVNPRRFPGVTGRRGASRTAPARPDTRLSEAGSVTLAPWRSRGGPEAAEGGRRRPACALPGAAATGPRGSGGAERPAGCVKESSTLPEVRAPQTEAWPVAETATENPNGPRAASVTGDHCPPPRTGGLAQAATVRPADPESRRAPSGHS